MPELSTQIKALPDRRLTSFKDKPYVFYVETDVCLFTSV